MTINIEWKDQFGRWHHFQTKQHQADAYRVAQRRAESTGKRHRQVDDSGNKESMIIALGLTDGYSIRSRYLLLRLRNAQASNMERIATDEERDASRA